MLPALAIYLIEKSANNLHICIPGHPHINEVMTIDELQKICRKHKGVTQDIKWDYHLCFNVGGKMFLITSPDEVPISASFKASDEEFPEISAQPGFCPAPYMARHKWVKVDDISRMNKKKWEHFIEQSYRLVLEKLPKKEQAKIIGK